MTALLALLAAVGYGLSDFLGGVCARRAPVAIVSLAAQAAGALVAVVAALVLGAVSTSSVLGWSALAGVGSALGTIALFRGLSVGRISIVAPVSALTAAALPAVLGVAQGERPSPLAWLGIALTLPAVWLVSRVPDDHTGPTGLPEAIAAGVGISLIYIGLNRAGNGSGTWPVAWEMLVATLLLSPVGWRAWSREPGGTLSIPAVASAATAGCISVAASLCYLAASVSGLAVAAVIASLYPAFTVLLALLFLHEWVHLIQTVGLGLAATSVVLIAL